jgi:hypothetical protein
LPKCFVLTRLASAICIATVASSCALVESISPFRTDPSKPSVPELWAELDDYATSFSTEVRRAADTVRDGTSDRSVQRTALRWKMEIVTEFRRAMQQDDPLAALLDLWSLTVQVRQGLESTPPFVDLGAARGDTLDAVKLLESDVRAIADSVLDDAQLHAATTQIEDYSRRNPLVRGFGREIEGSESRLWQGYAALESVLAVPLSPIRALQGIDTGAQAIAEFASVADRFSTVVNSMPESLRWQLELLVFDLDDTPSLKALETGATTLAASSSRLATVAESLPQQIDRSVRSAVDRVVDPTLGVAPIVADARATAAEIRQAVEALDRAVTGARELTAGLDRVTAEFGSAGKEWAGALTVLRDITGPAKEPGARAASGVAETGPGTTEARPFDVREYGTAAAELARAAGELRATLLELDRLLDESRVDRATNRVDESARRAAEQATAAAEGIIDHAFRRALYLVLAVSIAALGYRLVAGRIARSSASGSSS